MHCITIQYIPPSVSKFPISCQNFDFLKKKENRKGIGIRKKMETQLSSKEKVKKVSREGVRFHFSYFLFEIEFHFSPISELYCLSRNNFLFYFFSKDSAEKTEQKRIHVSIVNRKAVSSIFQSSRKRSELQEMKRKYLVLRNQMFRNVVVPNEALETFNDCYSY